MRTIIVENETQSLAYLEDMLRKHFKQIDVVATAESVDEAVMQVVAHRPDLLLLDVEIKDGSGFDVLAALGNYSFAVIFITGFNKYAIQAIRFSALDYLMKPVMEAELAIALHRAEERLKQQQVQQQLSTLLDIVNRNDKNDFILTLPMAADLRLVCLTDIMWVEGEGSYTYFHLANGERLMVAYGMYTYLWLEGYGFVQTSKKNMANITHIKTLCKKDYIHELLLKDGCTKVHVSRIRVDMVREAISNWRKKN